MSKVTDNAKNDIEDIKKDKIVNFIIVVLFVLCSLFLGSFHEPWSDEAQSWLIAREQNIMDIFFYNSRYEGTFPLWILTLKLFISFGLPYKYIYIISTIISTIGISILLYKTKIPKIIKYLLPFSFYVLYQYTVVARSYCYFIVAFSILLALYEKRHEKSIRYFLNLILFSMISLYGMIISGVLASTYFIETIQKLKKGEKINNKKIIGFIILILIYCFEIYILIPPKDLLMDINYQDNIFLVILNILFRIFTNGENIFALIINSTIVGSWCIIISSNKKNKKMDFLLIEIITIGLFLFVRVASHHLGILFLILLTEYLIINDEKTTKLLTLCLSCYVILTVMTAVLDINQNYSGAKEMAQYIISIENYENKEIFGIGYRSIALLPYFDRNIYNNRTENYYLWSARNSDLVQYKYNSYIDFNNIKLDNGNLSEYILLDYHNFNNYNKKIQEAIEKSGLYELIYETDGKNFFKGSYSEKEGYFLYKLKENELN